MMRLDIPGRLTVEVADFAEASTAYRDAVEASGEGGSTFPSGTLTGTGIYRVSYNGRVWEADGVLVYCPGSAPKDEGRPDIYNEGREAVWGRKRDNPYLADTVKHRVFERGAAFARTCYAGATA